MTNADNGQFIGYFSPSHNVVYRHLIVSSFFILVMGTYLGIDISSDFIHIACEDNTTWVFTKVENELKAIDGWISTMPEDIHVIFEYTGTYSHRLAYGLSLRERTFSMITPSQSKGFAASLKNKAKTDAQDAKVLALYGSKMQPEPTILTDESLHQKKQIYKHYNDLIAQKQALNNKIHALSFDPRAAKKVVDSLEVLDKVYQQQIEDFQEQLFDLNDDEFKQLKDKLMQITGIGPKAATGIIIQTNGLKNFHSAKALAAFLGLVPTTKQSGTSLKSRGRLVNTACKQLRSILFCAAQSAAKFNLDCKELYTRLLAKGKSKKAAKMAVAHKLIRQAFAIVKNNAVFQNDFQANKIALAK